MQSYIKLGSYNESVMYIIIVATAYVLNLNILIDQKGPHGNIQMIQ